MLLGVLAVGTTFAKMSLVLTFVEVMFILQLQQKLLLFEVRRVQCDVRMCPTSLIHRITPRFKALLQECHLHVRAQRHWANAFHTCVCPLSSHMCVAPPCSHMCVFRATRAISYS